VGGFFHDPDGWQPKDLNGLTPALPRLASSKTSLPQHVDPLGIKRPIGHGQADNPFRTFLPIRTFFKPDGMPP
jgi:hypothetical protein